MGVQYAKGSDDAAPLRQVKAMSRISGSTTSVDQPMVYQIRFKGHLGGAWTDWFGGMAIDLTEDGAMLLTGPVADQAALHGLLKKVRDLAACRRESLLSTLCLVLGLQQVEFGPTQVEIGQIGVELRANGCLWPSIFVLSDRLLGLPLLSVQCVEPNDKGANRTHPKKESPE